MRGYLGDAIRAAGMIAARHQGLAAKILYGAENSLIVGGDDYPSDALGLFGAFVSSGDHRAAGNFRERLSGEADGIVPRRNDDDGVLIFRVTHLCNSYEISAALLYLWRLCRLFRPHLPPLAAVTGGQLM